MRSGQPHDIRSFCKRAEIQRDAVIDCEDLFTVSSDLLTSRLGEVDPTAQDAVDRALRIALALP